MKVKTTYQIYRDFRGTGVWTRIDPERSNIHYARAEAREMAAENKGKVKLFEVTRKEIDI